VLLPDEGPRIQGGARWDTGEIGRRINNSKKFNIIIEKDDEGSNYYLGERRKRHPFIDTG
jgi:hypothetical protein